MRHIESHDIRERLARYAHANWIGALYPLFEVSEINEDGSMTVSMKEVAWRRRLMETPYARLEENDKEISRWDADRILEIVGGGIKGE